MARVAKHPVGRLDVTRNLALTSTGGAAKQHAQSASFVSTSSTVLVRCWGEGGHAGETNILKMQKTWAKRVSVLVDKVSSNEPLNKWHWLDNGT